METCIMSVVIYVKHQFDHLYTHNKAAGQWELQHCYCIITILS